MSDELTLIWRMRLRVLFAEVVGIKGELQWLRSRLEVAPMHPTPTLPPSSLNPTDTPSPIPSPSLLKRMVASSVQRMGMEAVSGALLWVGGRLATWALYALLGLPALAWLVKPALKLLGLG